MPFGLRITLLLSVSVHIVCFGIFEPKFSNSVKKNDFARVSFLGSILQTSDLSVNFAYRDSINKNIGNQLRPLKFLSLIKKKEDDSLVLKTAPIKPKADMKLLDKGNISSIPELDIEIFNRRKKEPTIIFHPPLPYSFLLYFKDRQIAHIEFMFYISSRGQIASIKRKISSGNLDVDLLALRYIAHCLNLVEGRFPEDVWQTVEIDLTRKND